MNEARELGSCRVLLLFRRIVFWQPVSLLAFNHCAYRIIAGRISYSYLLMVYFNHRTKNSSLSPTAHLKSMKSTYQERRNF